MFNYIDNSSGQALAHLVEILPCEDFNENDQLIGPIKIIGTVLFVNLINDLTNTDSFNMIDNQNQTWTKISNISDSIVNICN
jgi:hypothetical protein